MRRSVLLMVMVAALLLVSFYFLRPGVSHAPPKSAVQAHPSVASPASGGSANPVPPSAPASDTPNKQIQAGTAQEDSPADKHAAYVASREEELATLSMNDDSASLEAILAELGNRDPEIRKAALQAAVQFGSRDAIPRLQEAAIQTDDPKEKTEILEAVEFLKLPSATEVIAQANAARGVTNSRKAPAGRPNPAIAPGQRTQ